MLNYYYNSMVTILMLTLTNMIICYRQKRREQNRTEPGGYRTENSRQEGGSQSYCYRCCSVCQNCQAHKEINSNMYFVLYFLAYLLKFEHHSAITRVDIDFLTYLRHQASGCIFVIWISKSDWRRILSVYPPAI